jgi:hypothetical protein
VKLLQTLSIRQPGKLQQGLLLLITKIGYLQRRVHLLHHLLTQCIIVLVETLVVVALMKQTVAVVEADEVAGVHQGAAEVAGMMEAVNIRRGLFTLAFFYLFYYQKKYILYTYW